MPKDEQSRLKEDKKEAVDSETIRGRFRKTNVPAEVDEEDEADQDEREAQLHKELEAFKKAKQRRRSKGPRQRARSRRNFPNVLVSSKTDPYESCARSRKRSESPVAEIIPFKRGPIVLFKGALLSTITQNLQKIEKIPNA